VLQSEIISKFYNALIKPATLKLYFKNRNLPFQVFPSEGKLPKPDFGK